MEATQGRQCARLPRLEYPGRKLRHSAANDAPGILQATLPLRPKSELKFYAIINYEDDYVQPLIMSAMETLFPEGTWKALPNVPPLNGEALSLAGLLPDPSAKLLQITPYETIDFEYAADHSSSVFVNSYMIRKALIRKHYLSATVETWVAKNPDSALKRGVKRSEHFEVDYAEFLDDALVDAFDLRDSMDRNDREDADPKDREWWILKPGMSDRGQGIRLFDTMEKLQDIFDVWEAERPDSDDEDEEDEDGGQGAGGDYITTSHLRHFVAQPYIHPPLLLAGDGRKFHLRTYVLALGCLKVYVYSDMLALFAAKPYLPPWEEEDLDAHLTNTCLRQGDSASSSSLPPVRRFRDLSASGDLSPDTAGAILAQIRAMTGDLFEGAARGMTVHFQPQPNAFEVYGLDFMVGGDGTAWLLEVNAFPDFKQSGEGAEGELKGVVAGFWREVVRTAASEFFGVESVGGGEEGAALELVREVDLGRR